MKTKQVRPQRRLLGGESAMDGDRIKLIIIDENEMQKNNSKVSKKIRVRPLYDKSNWCQPAIAKVR